MSYSSVSRKARSLREFARGLVHTAHPLLVQIIPIRRCNIDCGYCNEYDKVSPPVPTTTISADLTTRITPCQFGGEPDCANCGCIASAGLAAVARHHLLGFIPIGSIFTGSVKIGERMRRLRPAEPSAA